MSAITYFCTKPSASNYTMFTAAPTVEQQAGHSKWTVADVTEFCRSAGRQFPPSSLVQIQEKVLTVTLTLGSPA